jgi:HlyD family secretion protein
VGLSAVGAGIYGTGLAIENRSASPPPGQNEPIKADYAVGSGHVDVPSRIANLYPVQPGQVVELPVKENLFVKKGTVLLRVNDRNATFQLQLAEKALLAAQEQLQKAEAAPAQHAALVEEAEAGLGAAQQDRGNANSVLKKKQELFDKKQGLISEEEIKIAQGDLKKAEEGVKRMEAKLKGLKLGEKQINITIAQAKTEIAAKTVLRDQAKYALEECALKAPADGTILRILVSVGDTLGANPREPAIIFCPAEKRIVRAEIDQEFAGKVKVGQSALIEDESREGKTWKGRVISLSDWYAHKRSILPEPRQFNDVRTLECVVEVVESKDSPKLRIGQRVRVIFGK